MFIFALLSSLTILCISPVVIPNPNKGKKFKPGDIFSLKDCTSDYIRVPCGHCPECIHTRQMYLCQRSVMESLNSYLFFATLTYNKESLPILSTSLGFDIPFADWRDLQLVFKRIRAKNLFSRPFRFLAVSERGSEKGRPHFHILFFLPKYHDDDDYTPFNLEALLKKVLLEQWSRNIGSKRKPIYKPICTYKEAYRFGRLFRNFDLHYVSSSISDDGVSAVCFYVIKYMLKRSDKETKLQQALHLNYEPEEFLDIWSTVRSRVDTSLYYGLHGCNPEVSFLANKEIVDYLRYCITRSDDFPKFFMPSDGSAMPLASYYKNFPSIYSFPDALRFYRESDNNGSDSVIEYDQKAYSQLIKSVNDYEKKISEVSDRGDLDNISAFFD